MAGLIRRGDIDEVRSRTNIADVVGDFVTLKSAGVGSMKGLCPFHDERSPSFHVRPQVGFYHCFGCGEGGDVFTFLQKMDHVTFSEAVERLAAKIGYQLHYEDGGTPSDQGNRARLLAANEAAREYFAEQLTAPGADAGRAFLGERGFDAQAAARFGVGYAPQGWDNLGKHLKGRGFTEAELTAAGLLSAGDRGTYDRFRGRLIWPIRDQTGQTVGFGARRLFDDDKGPKYLNTPETPVYHKAQVLYGLDLAKRDISRSRQVVVVEGYTDVMACHLAGVTTAVATCGTSFGVDHIKIMRRVLADDSAGLGEVVFTFDPDAAGQKAALRAFSEEQRFAAQTYVAVAPDGLDPCDLRLAKGDDAVRRLVKGKRPMFEFVIKQKLSAYDLETVEGRVAALRDAAPIVAEIRDPAVRPGYARQLAKMLGLELDEVNAAVARGRSGNERGGDRSGDRAGNPSGRVDPRDRAALPAGGSGASGGPGATSPAADPLIDSVTSLAPIEQRPSVSLTQLPSTTAVRTERDALMAILQAPVAIGRDLLVQASVCGFSHPALAAVRDSVGRNVDSFERPDWMTVVQNDVPEEYRSLVEQLAVAPIPERPERQVELYLRRITISLIERDILRRKELLLGRLQRTDAVADPAAYREVQVQLVQLEADRRAFLAE
ncbi:DNA primase [Herbiconiux sp. CPCC 203407]|uniref:DNA primase n=1 Tax=Herbiconiux oxytropis TaxID=2970915 RepID=A0AA41XH19_9MICO|nr:DNA primase [Herbiconiux oxytropis]MCS5720532.1 DNA primase [Herbiconiux oxytropis]MCS5726105.1 DNA primase [Herbiconiux oxytropis]